MYPWIVTLKVTKSPTDGEPVGTRRKIEKPEFLIGRDRASDWTLPGDPMLSRPHCKIICSDGGVSIVDTSKNGLWVNGEKLDHEGSATLKDGDELVLGEYELMAGIEPLSVSAPEGTLSDAVPIVATGADPEPEQNGDRPHLKIPKNWRKKAGATPQPAQENEPGEEPGQENERQPSQDGKGDYFDAFLAGAGLKRSHLAGVDPAASLRMSGETYRQIVNGVCDVLEARSEFKSEFRIEHTRIAAAENNPLKISHNADQALLQMLNPNPRFKRAPEAMQEALTDIKTHQLALIAAVKVALAGVLEQINPQVLESRLGPSVMQWVPGGKKAELWSAYEAMYKQIAEELDEDFRGTVGRAFAEAYEKYIDQK